MSAAVPARSIFLATEYKGLGYIFDLLLADLQKLAKTV